MGFFSEREIHVYELGEEGLSVEEIAERLDMSIDDVKRCLDLDGDIDDDMVVSYDELSHEPEVWLGDEHY